jgi:predicted transcriptional regulator
MNGVDSLYGFEMKRPDKRRAKPGERKTHNIIQLWQRSHEILRMALIGMKETEIAKVLGVTPATVSNTVNSDLGREKLSLLRKERDGDAMDVVKEVSKLFPKALKIYESLLEGNGTKLQKETADTLLMDIGGHRAPTRVQSESAHMHLTPADIEEFKKRGLAAAKASGMLIETEKE